MAHFAVGDQVYFMSYDSRTNRERVMSGVVEQLVCPEGLIAVQACDGTRKYLSPVELFLTRGEAERANAHATRL